MDSDAELKSIKDEVFREIGRNVVAFQTVEHLLKALLGAGRVEGAASELAAARERRVAESAKLTMGVLVGKFAEEILATPVDDAEMVDRGNEISISFSFRLESDDAFSSQQKLALETLVDQRNELIHHFLPMWDWKSVESMGKALRYLVLQRERTEAQRAFLARVWLDFQETLKMHAAFINSDEGAQQFELLWLQQSRIVSLLCEFAAQSARADGNVSVASAGSFVHTHAKEDMLDMKKRYGFNGLLALIVGAELFEVMEEPTTNGVRQMYRMRDRVVH